MMSSRVEISSIFSLHIMEIISYLLQLFSFILGFS